MDLAALPERLLTLLQGPWSAVAGRFGISTILDIAIVALVLYWLLSLIAGTSAATLVRGILILLTLGFVLSNVFNLTMLQFLLRNSIPALIFAIPVLFQPEIRRALEQLGRAGSLIPRTTVASPNNRLAETIARAAQQLAERRFGALLVIERSTPLGE
jgi:diadenylate cyclase